MHRPCCAAPLLAGGAIYHCGPVVPGWRTGKWHFVAAGPTTTSREEPYQAEVIGSSSACGR